MPGGAHLTARRIASAVAPAVAVLAVAGCGGGTVQVTPPHPDGDALAACRRLADALPERVSDETRRTTTPDSRLTAAWGSPPITLRCGVARPRAYTPTAQLFTVNGVDWLPVPPDAPVPTRFYVVGRVAYVELTVPEEHQPAADALVDAGHAVSKADPKDRTQRP